MAIKYSSLGSVIEKMCGKMITSLNGFNAGEQNLGRSQFLTLSKFEVASSVITILK